MACDSGAVEGPILNKIFQVQRADFLGPPCEQREDRTLKAFRQIADPRAPHRHRPTHHRERARFAVAVSAPRWRIDGRHRSPAFVPDSAEERGHFLLQELLQLGLDLPSRPLLQRVITHRA
jgi:hypothetical protein